METKVLFVDDEVNILKSMLREFKNAPFKSYTAASAFDAFDIIEKEDIKVIVSDQRMPGLEGDDFISLVRAQRPEIVCIILTGYASLDSAINAINRGDVFRYLEKPVKYQQLYDTIMEAIEYQISIAGVRHDLDEKKLKIRVEEELDKQYPEMPDSERYKSAKFIATSLSYGLVRDDISILCVCSDEQMLNDLKRIVSLVYKNVNISTTKEDAEIFLKDNECDIIVSDANIADFFDKYISENEQQNINMIVLGLEDDVYKCENSYRYTVKPNDPYLLISVINSIAEKVYFVKEQEKDVSEIKRLLDSGDKIDFSNF